MPSCMMSPLSFDCRHYHRSWGDGAHGRIVYVRLTVFCTDDFSLWRDPDDPADHHQHRVADRGKDCGQRLASRAVDPGQREREQLPRRDGERMHPNDELDPVERGCVNFAREPDRLGGGTAQIGVVEPNFVKDRNNNAILHDVTSFFRL